MRCSKIYTSDSQYSNVEEYWSIVPGLLMCFGQVAPVLPHFLSSASSSGQLSPSSLLRIPFPLASPISPWANQYNIDSHNPEILNISGLWEKKRKKRMRDVSNTVIAFAFLFFVNENPNFSESWIE